MCSFGFLVALLQDQVSTACARMCISFSLFDILQITASSQHGDEDAGPQKRKMQPDTTPSRGRIRRAPRLLDDVRICVCMYIHCECWKVARCVFSQHRPVLTLRPHVAVCRWVSALGKKRSRVYPMQVFLTWVWMSPAGYSEPMVRQAQLQSSSHDACEATLPPSKHVSIRASSQLRIQEKVCEKKNRTSGKTRLGHFLGGPSAQGVCLHVNDTLYLEAAALSGMHHGSQTSLCPIS